MGKQSVISDNMPDVDVFLQGVDAIANEFLGADRYDVYRASRDAAIAQLAAATQRESELREALEGLMWRFEEDDGDPFEPEVAPDVAIARRLLAPPVDAEGG